MNKNEFLNRFDISWAAVQANYLKIEKWVESKYPSMSDEDKIELTTSLYGFTLIQLGVGVEPAE